jgi:predicted restriction endonuclease
MLAGEGDKKKVDTVKIRCEICGLSFANENEKQKHLELEHMKGKKPAGVR